MDMRSSRWKWCWLAIVPAIGLGLIGYAALAYRLKYPVGREHCCDKGLGMALLNYAELNGGRFPSGGATPEASLSLLYPKFLDASVLRGKMYPLEPAQKLLESGQPLTPDTCGWHYVEGLRISKENCHGIAIFWDKIGSDHNSGLLPEGDHSVTFMDGHGQVIKAADWVRFIADQEKAWAAIRRGETPPPTWMPDGF